MTPQRTHSLRRARMRTHACITRWRCCCRTQRYSSREAIRPRQLCAADRELSAGVLIQRGRITCYPALITAAPASVGYGQPFTVTTPDAAQISSVVLVHNGSVTHAYDKDQRVVGLSFTAGNGSLTVTSPPNTNIAPPGYYMLFLLNSAGVPSVASFVQVIPATGDYSLAATPTSQTVAQGTARPTPRRSRPPTDSQATWPSASAVFLQASRPVSRLPRYRDRDRQP